ncbi:MAG: hypothetical protein A3C79_01410 [Candidatus Taylorbacteria bacterium RIFCSPHIGHO2_02_FULL_45_28]|uniref:Phage-Barnase-EndoU-ColicinE5/D-RelE like nuclease 3 domain-containing protein n=1 Tax=Candidatus Taylorbacteria bacterium RIFCSPHIGHO2_12_FULL_45_16 TaxID=1802315 RepID=A0A1G2MYM2_9BACT|nr:MAG: hypothetical protein A2830_03575 [Candidatus Taylorbacteria bacterium RIFCSPHIGHO2_01_FULL_44_110]OHA25099.1 MAG: hypothetical protein A3C79_01410 [Candidatus Taylorbacteria bacterium RIFCSPHIGHO2_02_FULL_45_28]OHA28980.1 MAG: hypothetical protein A3F51_01795 [Candidatus Taylorbacteria bacterium RIFCSPHIGHO2_12_FULL_45_16]OHA33098.1 MAG: hypothetical protein A3A23_03475 [Candidatus Taylorbacteria bacterium RIFCSPLOWO2_01_FULL_45_59]OHA39413.1 MAG: hypothetical protein A3I98_02460 [Candi
MSEELWRQFIQKARESYYKIGAIPCPAFDGELVYFNKYGWNHIIRKKGKVRHREEQIRRILLIPYLAEIIKTSIHWKDHRTGKENSEFWSFSKKFNDKTITVVVRRDMTRKYFFSVMDARNTKGPY